MNTTGASDESVQLMPDTHFATSVFGGAGDGKKDMLRKKCHVVRKKNHVVRKLFYVASIFGGAASRKSGAPTRKKRKPWKKVPTPWKKLPTASILSGKADGCNEA